MRARWFVSLVLVAGACSGGTGGGSDSPPVDGVDAPSDVGSEGSGSPADVAPDAAKDGAETATGDPGPADSLFHDGQDTQEDPTGDASVTPDDSAGPPDGTEESAPDLSADSWDAPSVPDEAIPADDEDLDSILDLPTAQDTATGDAAIEVVSDLPLVPEGAAPDASIDVVADPLAAGDAATADAATEAGPDTPSCSALTTEVLCYVTDWSGGIDDDPLAVFVELGGQVGKPFLIQDSATFQQAWSRALCGGAIPSVAFGTESVVGFANSNKCHGCLYVKNLDLCGNDATFLFSSFDNTGCMASTVGILLVRVPAAGYTVSFSTTVENDPALRWCPCPPPADLEQCWHPPEPGWQ